MRSQAEVESLKKQAENMIELDRKELGRLLENREENEDEILTVEHSIDRLVGSIQAYNMILD